MNDLTILWGYFFERQKKRDFEITKKRQEIYTKFIKNLVEKLEFFDELREDPNIPEGATIENVPKIMELIRERHTKLNENIIESNEINALLALYGDDRAVKACAKFFQDVYASIQPNSTVSPDKYRLLCDLRKTLFPKTTVSPKDIYFITSKYSEYSE